MIIKMIDKSAALLYNSAKEQGAWKMRAVTECPVGCEGTIVKIRAREPVRGRLVSLGMAKGSRLRVLDHTLAKQTWEVDCDGTRIALREEEAAQIFVKPLEPTS